MTCFVTGGEGQLGFDIIRTLKEWNKTEIVAPTHEQLDITDKQAVRAMLIETKPDIIFHCAAYTNVDLAEEEPERCKNVNVDGTRYLAEMAKELDAKLVYISTDYVFDGTKIGKYNIEDPVHPLNVYGKTKWDGEEIVRKLVPKSFIVRTSWLFGIHGNNFIKKMFHLAESKNEVDIVSDQFGSPTYTKDLARFIINLAQTDYYGTYHATNEGDTTWADLARYVFISNHLDVTVNDVTTAQYPTPAKRPSNSKLSKHKITDNGFILLPVWQNAVDRYSQEYQGLKEGSNESQNNH